MIEGTEMEADDTATIVMKAHKAGNQVPHAVSVLVCLRLHTRLCVYVLELLLSYKVM